MIGLLNITQSRLLMDLEALWWDRRLGISTRGFDRRWYTPEHCYCGPTPYRLIFRILGFLAPSGSDVLVDLGCGKGRVLCCGALKHQFKLVGIEDVPQFVEMARNNAQRRLDGRGSSISVVQGNAEAIDYEPFTLIYMCNPFGAATLEAVLGRLSASIERRPRPVRIAYINPEHETVMEKKAWLERYAHWPAKQWWGFLPSVSFWRNHGQGAQSNQPKREATERSIFGCTGA